VYVHSESVRHTGRFVTLQELAALTASARIQHSHMGTSPETHMVKIIECPRDAWQGLPKHIPAEEKVEYLRSLIDAGFAHIDAASFVSSIAVPQMADSELVLASLELPANVELIGIVVNERGAARAIDTHKITTLGYPYSVSPTFLQQNQRQTAEEALANLESISLLALQNKLGLVVYISMAFGNPYGDPWSEHQVVDVCKYLIERGVKQISLADTVGLASPEQVAKLASKVIAIDTSVEIGVHLHAKPQDAASLIRAAYNAGCRRFDTAIGGLGGCPFAQEDLVGNLPTEILIRSLEQLGAELPPMQPLEKLLTISKEISGKYGATK
jgi:hydroxymethylglutaryl-CoA lyase